MVEASKDDEGGNQLEVSMMYALELTFPKIPWPIAQKLSRLGLQLPLLPTQQLRLP